MDKERVYLSTQLLSVLPPIVLKVASFLCNWQNSPNGIMLYEHRFAKTLKMTEEEVRISIQTLINLKLIDLTNIDNKWKIEFNPTEWQKYYKIPMDKVIEHECYKLATEVTYDKVQKEDSFSNLSDDQLEKMIRELQRRKEEKKKGCQVIYANATDDNYCSNLPFQPMKVFKKYEYWASENGKPVKKWTDFFLWNSDIRDEWQLKGKLRNFYKEE